MAQLRTAVAWATVWATLGRPVDAQRPVGDVSGVRQLLSCRPDTRVATAPAQSVMISRAATAALNAGVGDVVQVSDTIVVRRMIDAKMFAPPPGRGFGEGDVVFAPELGTCTTFAAQFQERGRRLGGSRPGRYIVTSRAERLAGRDTTRLVISVEYGGLVADWKGGLFSLIALGREIRLTGTRLALVVDSAGTEAFVAVVEGAVQVFGAAGAAATRVNAGQVARFQVPGSNVVVQSLAADVTENLRYHLRDVWDLPVQPPALPPLPPSGPAIGKILGALVVGAGVVAGGIYAYQHWIKDDSGPRRRSGNLVIRIPI